ncbi:TIGR02594 family protein [Aquimarina agarilytica]|uniref:TIGR02594 family protein n=1 Tax=Aquimarina agarilytica TaxID=1087449 RepID=UPI00028952DA|nr:TIGR02594 family protein [Aquimarina agarilytica]
MNTSLINTALSQYGIKEYQNSQNPEILKYFHEIGKSWVTTDETAWCSAFVNWVAKMNCFVHSGELTARSWANIGTTVNNPSIGDIVIFWRESLQSWKGHVGFYIGYSEDRKWIYCLGGNQNNQVNIKAYPSYRLLGFRRLASV